jgi:hypothetical protein
MRRRGQINGGVLDEAGAGHDDIDVSLFGRNGREQPVEVGEVRDVALNSRHASADRRFGFVQFRLPARGDEDVRAFFDNLFAVARPIPLLPPVTTATFPSTFGIFDPFALTLRDDAPRSFGASPQAPPPLGPLHDRLPRVISLI